MSRSSEINKTVKDEVQKIPKFPEEYQAELRQIYTTLRQNSLGKSGDLSQGPGEIMQEAVASVMNEHPEAELKYDRVFFRCKA